MRKGKMKRSTKHYTENLISSNMNPTKTGGELGFLNLNLQIFCNPFYEIKA
jgi:hypothetical protein